MKKQLVASLVGGLLLFVWQFLSWSLLNVHGAEFRYTANQDKIMEVLSQNLEAGSYVLPQAPPGSTHEEQQKVMENSMGKAWASVSYHKNFDQNMGMSMFRAFVVDILAVFLLTWLLLKFANLDFKTALLASWAVGGITYLTVPYLNSIWFETNTIGYIIDTVVQWGLVGAWLGWWLTRRAAAV